MLIFKFTFIRAVFLSTRGVPKYYIFIMILIYMLLYIFVLVRIIKKVRNTRSTLWNFSTRWLGSEGRKIKFGIKTEYAIKVIFFL